jgi:adenosylhomocysteine nucleosidase
MGTDEPSGTGGTEQADGSGEAGARPPGVGVLILAPMVREARPLARSLGLRPVAVGGGAAWDGPRGLIAVVGVGPEEAAARTVALVTRVRPTRVLVAGVCGALDTTLAVGDLVVPTTVVDTATARTFTPCRARPPALPGKSGILATVQRFGDAAPDGAIAVDMETAVVAATCEELGVPWDVRRTVSDVPGGVREGVAGLMKPSGGVDAGALTRLLVRHPGQLATLLALARQLHIALEVLGRAIAAELGD